MYALDSHAFLSVTRSEDTYVYDIQSAGQGACLISSDDILRLIDPVNLREVGSIKVNKDVTSMAVIGEETAPLVVTAGRDGCVHIWDPRTGQEAGELKTGTNCILSTSIQFVN